MNRLTVIRKQKDKGFSLIETLVAVTMFGIVLMATGWAVITGLNAQAEAEARDKAVQVSQAAMSIALKTDYDKIGFTIDQNDTAATDNCYADPNYYILPEGIQNPDLVGQTQPRVTVATQTNSDLVPCVQKISDVQDWKKETIGRDFKVTTNITVETWTLPGDTRSYSGTELGVSPLPDDAIITGKRITVETRWLVTNDAGNCPDLTDPTGVAKDLGYRCVYQSFVRTPGAGEQIPIGMGTGTASDADACNIDSPVFCRVYATEGNVLASNPGPTGNYPQSKAVQMFMETRYPVSASEVSAYIQYPEVDRGKACGSRQDGTAIEYGFCGDGTKIPAKTVTIGPATGTNPDGWKLISDNGDGKGTLLMALLTPDNTESQTDSKATLKGNIRPGEWRVLFQVDNDSYVDTFRWSYADATPLTARVTQCPASDNDGALRFVVDGLSPNSEIYGDSRYSEGFGLDKYEYDGGTRSVLGTPVNRAALDHMEVRGTRYFPNGTQSPGTLQANTYKNAQWDQYALTMSQEFRIPGNSLALYWNTAANQLNLKVNMTRAIDGIRTTSLLTCYGEDADAPTNLEVDTEGVATWYPPADMGGAEIYEYTVTAYASSTSSAPVSYCTTTGELTCTLPGLSENTKYHASVVATYLSGSSPASNPRTSFIFHPAYKPDQPTGLTVTPKGVANWTAPTSDGGAPITKYTVSVYPSEVDNVVIKTCTTNGSTTCTIGTLVDGVTYFASVVATNSEGDGAPSSPRVPFIYDGSTVPGPPRNLSVTTSGVAKWSAPASNGLRQITTYTITAYDALTGGNPIGSCTSAGLTCKITGLTDGTTYYASAYATNVNGNGAESDPRLKFTFLLPNATGGDRITEITDNGVRYRVHEFLNNGTSAFVPNQNMTVDYLIVGGGGGGGNPCDRTGGGGGAGGFVSGSGTLTGSKSYSVTVGAGGGQSNRGANSVLDTKVAYGGGWGGQCGRNASSGGSGGGGHHNNPTGYTLAPGVAGQGNNGGSGWDSGNVGVGFYAGGGGGASAPGRATCVGCNQGLGHGGNGKSSTITGGTRWYAGGGGGGTQVFGGWASGGQGGGGRGGNNDGAAPGAGVANTGGGGGGGSCRINGGCFGGASGGSGTVIIRYPID